MASNASFVEAASVAVNSLRGSKLRSFLTLLGVILATTTLIAVMSLINGMNRYIAKQVSDMGVDGFRIRRIVMIGRFDPKTYLAMEKKNPQMSREEFRFLKDHATLIREIGMESFRSCKAQFQAQSIDGVNLAGVTPNMAEISNMQTISGRFFTESDERRRLMVAYIGNDLKTQFFPNVNAVGKTVSIDGRAFEVIGVAKPRGSVFGQSRDNFAMLPAETFFKIYGSQRGIGYNALALDPARLNEAQDEARSLLRAFRHVGPGEEDNFGILASDSLVAAWDRLTGTIAATAVAIVSVFMVVGGVVIMNIMLAVVTERTREIGIRKSVGARRRDILNQFLVESSMLSAIGGAIGVTTAWIAAVLIRNLTPVPMAVPFSAILIGIGLSSAVGLFFGVYPARRAARLDPIEALRHE